jgi:hypothetical protein
MHLEKLHHSRDDRIRTIRVDSFGAASSWRRRPAKRIA